MSLRLTCCLFAMIAGSVSAVRAEIFKTVGPSGDVATVQAAIDAVPAGNAEQKIILIKPGAYFGHTVLAKPHVTLRGSGPDTLLTYNLGQAIPGADGQPIGWSGASALLITAEAHDAVVENLTLENTYGQGMQAQALSVSAERVAFRRCRIIGWQDTIRLESGLQFFEQCYISGHVDFIYGAATAFFEDCEIFSRASGYIVAPATPEGKTGFVFERCRLTFPYGNPPTYLGRPWKNSPAATFVRCEFGAGIRAEGWKEWNVKPPLVRFAEYENTGPGAATAGRAPWSVAPAGPAPAQFTRAAVLGDWKPFTP